MSDLFYRFARWLLAQCGLIPRSEVESYAEAEAQLVKLGADVPARLRDAVTLEMAGVPDGLVMWLAKVSAQGVVWNEDLHRLNEIVPVQSIRYTKGGTQ